MNMKKTVLAAAVAVLALVPLPMLIRLALQACGPVLIYST